MEEQEVVKVVEAFNLLKAHDFNLYVPGCFNIEDEQDLRLWIKDPTRRAFYDHKEQA